MYTIQAFFLKINFPPQLCLICIIYNWSTVTVRVGFKFRHQFADTITDFFQKIAFKKP